MIDDRGEKIDGLHAGGRFDFKGGEEQHFVHPRQGQMQFCLTGWMRAIQLFEEDDRLPIQFRRKVRNDHGFASR